MTSMNYGLEFSEKALKKLRKLEEGERKRILNKLKWFSNHPDRSKNVKYVEKFDALRYRVGDFRVFFHKKDEEGKIRVDTIVRRPRAYN